MPRFPYKELDVELGRKFRSDMNQNFKDIEADIKELNGGQLEAVEAAHEAQAQAGYAQNAGDYANERGLYASEQGDYAKAQADKVKQSVENLGDLEQRIEVEIENSQTQSTYAKEQADRLKETNDHFKSVGDYDPLVTYYPYNIVEYNGSSYICITVSTGNLPTDTTYFNLFASKGEKGDRGDTGERGLQGIQGEQGLKGEKGDPGESFIWKGEYSPTKTYVINDTLAYNGSSYICIKNTTIGILPTDTNYFNLLSQRGIDGTGSIVSVNGKLPDLNGNVQIDANEIGAILVTEKNIPNGVATLNSDGKVVDIDGNEIEGKVKSVNNIQPDENGNITISIPTKTSQLTNDSSFETTTGSQSKADLAEQHAKEYTDQAIANANQGEVKMVYYPYVLKATTDNQTEFTIPLETFDAVNDFLQVVQNTTVLNKEEHYTVTGKTITLNQGVTTGTSLFITIIKNTLVGAEGAVNGNLIKDGSLPLNKLTEQIPTLDSNGNVLDGNGNIVEGKVKTVNNTQPDENGNVSISIPTKTSELTNDSNFATTENVNIVSTNLENHESKIASTTDLGHVKVDGTSITINEDGVIKSVAGEIPNINTSTSEKAVYVDSSLGTDSPEKGSSSGEGAYKTIQYAINAVKKFNIGIITINVSEGSYMEDVSINGFLGATIKLIGSGDTKTTIPTIKIDDCQKIFVARLNIEQRLTILNTTYFNVYYNKSTSTNAIGVDIQNSNGRLYGMNISNKDTALNVYNSTLWADFVEGTENRIGIVSNASTVRKSATSTITGTTPTQLSNGGQILS